MTDGNSRITFQSISIGDKPFVCEKFIDLDKHVNQLVGDDWRFLSSRLKFSKINSLLLNLINNADDGSFLLPAIINFIESVNVLKLIEEPYRFKDFEFWFNHYARLNSEENYRIRGKIAGKLIPRQCYQVFFPIGMNKTYDGTHFIVAHLSPDVDTTIGSFFGWLDAFACRLSHGQHIWCVPGGAPRSPVIDLFNCYFGSTSIDILARKSIALTLSAQDIIVGHNWQKLTPSTPVLTVHLESNDKAVVLVDENGHFIGDWHSNDVEHVRQVTVLYKACMHWLQNTIQLTLISLLASEKKTCEEFQTALYSIFKLPLSAANPIRSFNEKQKNDLDLFFKAVVHIPDGISGSFEEFSMALQSHGAPSFALFIAKLAGISDSPLFDAAGCLVDNRMVAFKILEEFMIALDATFHEIRNFVELANISLQIKKDVLGTPIQYVTPDSDMEEIKSKIKNLDFIAVVVLENNRFLSPIGVIFAKDLRNLPLGTVSLRDFCNFDEMRMASYLTVISVIDHHKSSINTTTPPQAIIGDVQSTNVLIAEQAFLINDRYSLGNMTSQQIQQQLNTIESLPKTAQQKRLLKRLIQRKIAAENTSSWFISPQREAIEYLFYLHAILDDTDLLSKVSLRDIECVAELLNRLISLASAYESEAVHFDDIPSGSDFCQKACSRLLSNAHMYGIYSTIFDLREKDIELSLKSDNDSDWFDLFADVKEQNGCCRISQTKLFANNFLSYIDKRQKLRLWWYHQCLSTIKEKAEVDFYLHMISTIPSAREVYEGKNNPYPHKDELWFYSPLNQTAIAHFSAFLMAFRSSTECLQNSMSVEFYGPQAQQTAEIFHQYYFNIKSEIKNNEAGPSAILYFKPGTLNSRKAKITPYLPRLVN